MQCFAHDLALGSAPYLGGVIGFHVLEPLLALVSDGSEFTTEGTHAVISHGGEVVSMDGAAQGHLMSW